MISIASYNFWSNLCYR